jgi:hypothetical protein
MCHQIKFIIYFFRICISLQYMARLNADNIKNFLYELNEKKIPKKRFNSKILHNLLKKFIFSYRAWHFVPYSTGLYLTSVVQIIFLLFSFPLEFSDFIKNGVH